VIAMLEPYLRLFNLVVWGLILLGLAVEFIRSIRLVPNQRAFVVERLGRYSRTLKAGFHTMLPFLDKVVAQLDLREETIDVPPQECFTGDEVKVEVDGVMYISVIDPVKATYGITDYRFAAMQLAQTTTRAVIGKLDLDRTFEEREMISTKVVEVLERAGQTWGIRVHRYEIKNIQPPLTVQDAMEKQVTAERNRRAIVAKAEGEKQSMINRSEGNMQELVNRSEGERQRRVNEAEGRAQEITAIAEATAQSLEKLAAAIEQPGGAAALELQLAERFLTELQKLARPETEILLPLDLGRLRDILEGLQLSSGLDAAPRAVDEPPTRPSAPAHLSRLPE
jgi:regulator of protease activity HflC (stomatin/prohibitin superfamily)